jgi:CDP-diacylglycerol pyrophosphatase
MRSLLTKLVIGLIACDLTLSALGMFAVSPARQALWQAVRACVADFKLTGGSFPCLLVDLMGGEEQGYVVLRVPFGPPDTVLVPTRRVIGVEDPWLQSPNSPNYFDAAWRARHYLKGPDGRSPHPDEFALKVNSALTRSQDQLHIHLGCLSPAMNNRLSTLASGLPIGVWTPVRGLIPGSVLWGLRTGRHDLAGVEPFRLAAEGLGDRIRDRAQLMIFVTEVRVGDEELLILASDSNAPASGYQVGADELIDLACAVRSGLSVLN